MAILTNRVDAKQKENRKIGWQSPPPPEKKIAQKGKEIKNMKDKLRDMKDSMRQSNMHIMGPQRPEKRAEF